MVRWLIVTVLAAVAQIISLSLTHPTFTGITWPVLVIVWATIATVYERAADDDC